MCVDHVVEQVALVADHDHRRRIGLEEVLQPQRRFEIEMVRGLVEQQQVGRGEEQGRRARRASSSRPNSCRAGAAASPRRSRGRPGSAPRATARYRRRSRSAARGPRRAGRDRVQVSASCEQRGALGVGGEHGLERGRRYRSALPARYSRCRVRRGMSIAPSSGSIWPMTTFISVDLPAPLRPIRPTRLRAAKRRGGAVEDRAPAEAHRHTVQIQHGRAPITTARSTQVLHVRRQ